MEPGDGSYLFLATITISRLLHNQNYYDNKIYTILLLYVRVRIVSLTLNSNQKEITFMLSETVCEVSEICYYLFVSKH